MTAQLNCPSCQAGQGGNTVIGVVGTKDGSARVSLLPEQVPLQSISHLIPDGIPVTEVLRLAGPCAGGKCAHFRNERCTLASRIVAGLPKVADRLSKCAIRPSCRWWRQEGPRACYRCPAIVTEPFQASEVMQEVATPPAQFTSQEQETGVSSHA
jgi:hypothetical protein